MLRGCATSYASYASSARARLTVVRDGGEYLDSIERALDDLERAAPRFDICLYNAGMDPVETCSIGGLTDITPHSLARRERLVFDWCRAHHLPVAFVLAGGYTGAELDRNGIVELHRLSLPTAASTTTPMPES